MDLEPLFKKDHPRRKTRMPFMRVAGFMSGKGSNLRAIIEHERSTRDRPPPYKVVMIFSDRHESDAGQLGKDYGIPVHTRDIRGYYRQIGKPLRDLRERDLYDIDTAQLMREHYHIDCVALAGYTSLTSPLIHTAFLTTNIHPADLTITDDKGARKYIGLNAVRDAIDAGESELRSSVHLVDHEMDGGPLLLQGPPVPVEPDKSPSSHQERLKEHERRAYPLTLELIAKGYYQRDKRKNIHLNGMPIPHGIRL